MEGIDGKVFVVDNHSVDGSVRMVKEKFPEVVLIENSDNPGFSRANNQAIRMSNSEYVLLLNPDTVVEEDTFHTCIRYMDEHPGCGACGVKLIDGKGNYLPESKRGLPTPAVAFYKIFGLSALFPRSKVFGRYHLGFLDREQTQRIEVLSGAFMFIRREALNKAGLLDEAFFMYGEDIDLSYRIGKAGYTVDYHPATRIIHYRGESTKKGSLNYVFVFYQAMIIFARKHFSKEHARIFSLLIHMAVYLRAALAVLKRFVQRAWLPFGDAALFMTGMYFLKNYWAARSNIWYPYEFMWVVVPLYCLIWIGSIWLSGGYDRPLRISRAVRGIVAGTVLVLVIYGMLDEAHRYSRFLTLVGAAWAAVAAASLRMLSNLVIHRNVIADIGMKRILIIGDLEEATRIAGLLNQSPVKMSYLGIIHPNPQAGTPEGFAGNISRLKDMVEIFGINELIFCGKNLSSANIMDEMIRISHPELEYKIAPPERLFIIGSNSIETSGELYTVGLNAIDRPGNRRKKRIFDIVAASVLLVASPLLSIFVRKPGKMIRNLFRVLGGRSTLVGYVPLEVSQKLPIIAGGILHPLDQFGNEAGEEQMAVQLNMLYAKDYRLQHDLEILIRGWRNLDRD